MNTRVLIALLLFAVVSVHAQQKVIQLYNGAAPGSEKWTWDEQRLDSNLWHTPVVYNVTHPSLTVFAPNADNNTGTAVIVCPGGGFQALSIKSEGTDVAQWLQQKGITAFVLKYRVMHTLSNDPTVEQKTKPVKQMEEDSRQVIPLGIADTRQAIAYVRQHAAEFGISPSRIVIIGFSAGGTMAASSAYNYTPENRPDYVAPIYAYMPPALQGTIAADAPPMFLAAASDDGFGLAPHSVDLYNKWLASKHSAELHLYAKGNHGFGMRKQNLPTDAWIDRFDDWLGLNGLLKPIDPKVAAIMEKAALLRSQQDWPNIRKYAEDNSKVPPPAPNEKRVIFMGNSITEFWKYNDSAFFASRNYINRGISGQTTPQMLVRFREDVVNLKPAVVVILAGINDIAENTGPSKLEFTFGNIVSMAQLARTANIKVVISSVLPANHFPWRPAIIPTEKVIRLNQMLKDYCLKNNVVYLDYYSAMVDSEKGLPKNLANDGVHPTLEGYKIMEPMVEKAIGEALKRK
ncbi:MAG TPA: GDSL-type esterase/lipase family protein [Mucilaginibacter sp.]|nr:GDSL-type esterase/lipase family protein [Mucilaginibacter sp.]